MSYSVVQELISKNRSYQNLSPIGMVVHDTDDPGATAQNEQSYFNNNSISASAHAVIDWTSIIQMIPYNEVAWHAGPTANHKFLGVELCVPGSYDETKFQAVWDRSVWFFAYCFVNILKITTITSSNLMSHAEVSNIYKETDHQDPISYFTKYGRSVEDFRGAVQDMVNAIIPLKNEPVVDDVTANILDIQKKLGRLGINDDSNSKLIEDGINGPKTTQAIIKFQKIMGLNGDGIFGSQTMNAMNEIFSKPLLKISNNYKFATRFIQYRIGVAIDGMFGNNTLFAMKTYQLKHGLSSDGIVGPATWSVLIG